jgi:rhodanese-related sulfurtransferase
MRAAIVVAGLAALVACGTAPRFDFRSAGRPVYPHTVSVTELHGDSPARVLLDVRLPEDYAADPVLIPGALYRNPDDIERWASEIPAGADVVVYCVRGKWVSQKAAHYLSDRGVAVRSLEGGIEAWKAVNPSP